MADRLIPTTYATPTLALAAAGVGDRIVFEATAALSYTAQGLSKPGTANIQWINQRGAQIALTPSANTSFEPGSGWIVGEAAGSGFGFSITLSGANLPSPAGAVVYISSAKSCTFYDSTISGAVNGRNAIRVEAGASAASVNLYRCTVHEYARAPDNPVVGEWGVALVVNGGGATCTVNARDTTFYGDGANNGGVGIYAQSPMRSQATVERCVFRTQSWGVYLAGASAAVGVQLRYCVFAGHNHYGVEHAAAGDPPLVMKRCNFANNTLGDYKPIGAKTGVVADSNYYEVMEVQVAAGTWAKNHYDSVIGAPGATDVHTTIAAADFANFAGNDFDLGVASALRDVGNDAGGDGLDIIGRPAISGASADVAAYEYQAVDCGFDSLTQQGDRQHFRATFVPYPSGAQFPTQVDAENRLNWSLTPTPTDATLAVLTATRVSDYVYDLAMTHRVAEGTSLNVDASAISTTAGGFCNQPPDQTIIVAGDAYVDNAAPVAVTYAASPTGELIEV